MTGADRTAVAVQPEHVAGCNTDALSAAAVAQAELNIGYIAAGYNAAAPAESIAADYTVAAPAESIAGYTAAGYKTAAGHTVAAVPDRKKAVYAMRQSHPVDRRIAAVVHNLRYMRMHRSALRTHCSLLHCPAATVRIEYMFYTSMILFHEITVYRFI